MRIFLIILLSIMLVSYGCGSGGGGSGDSNSPDPKNNTSIIQNPVRENSVPLGLSTFALGIPNKFPLEDNQTAEGIGYKSIAKVVRSIATNELYTFPETPSRDQIKVVLQSFLEEGYQVTHEIHILNGPSMRKSKDPWINGIVGRNISDSEFVSLLQSNQTVRDAVQNLFSEVVGYAKTLEELGMVVIICPELEDNETISTFNILLGMLANIGWSDPTKLVRNGGRPGDHGIRYESHTYGNLGSLRPGDIFNNDGNTFKLNGDTFNAPGALTEDQMRSAINYTQNNGIIMFAWSAHLQGNQQISIGNFIPYPEFTNRNYVLDNPIGQASLLLQIPASEVILNK